MLSGFNEWSRLKHSLLTPINNRKLQSFGKRCLQIGNAQCSIRINMNAKMISHESVQRDGCPQFTNVILDPITWFSGWIEFVVCKALMCEVAESSALHVGIAQIQHQIWTLGICSENNDSIHMHLYWQLHFTILIFLMQIKLSALYTGFSHKLMLWV